ncbi:glutathione-dependent formaldehyde-activating enzyme [Colletotrichum simmondsii]|uniref:Glutathione-dependent formaldehyde-activating enzyme n=1 Tax=Colletotrichum simmondsii TaxID=703756 RepID=A0A135SL01_9PEZI|nr:glutathione-dependent formaldehyde-activating enzyme [Colletotrichum simmondsii]
MSSEEAPKPSKTYDASCHCGAIEFSLTLSPPLEDGYKVLNCNCSICRRSGINSRREQESPKLVAATNFCFLNSDPNKKDVTWHDGSREKCTNYRFNTKTKDQMFCGACGSSLGIDFLKEDYYGISARALDGIDLDALTYKKLDGLNRVSPAQDLSGSGDKEAST